MTGNACLPCFRASPPMWGARPKTTGSSSMPCSGLPAAGAPWRDLPERYGPWNSVYQRFRRWARKGVWQRVFEELQEPDLDWLLLDSTTVRAHQHAAGQKNDSPARGAGA